MLQNCCRNGRVGGAFFPAIGIFGRATGNICRVGETGMNTGLAVLAQFFEAAGSL
jgi:hypothetical protein